MMSVTSNVATEEVDWAVLYAMLPAAQQCLKNEFKDAAQQVIHS